MNCYNVMPEGHVNAMRCQCEADQMNWAPDFYQTQKVVKNWHFVCTWVVLFKLVVSKIPSPHFLLQFDDKLILNIFGKNSKFLKVDIAKRLKFHF